MSDRVVGNLTEEHQTITGRLVSTNDSHISGSLSPKSRTLAGSLDSHGTKDYNQLRNKPSINGQTLTGDTIIIEDKTFIYDQDTPSDTWRIRHNLDKYPSITVVDSSGEEVIGAVEYVDVNNVILIFIGAFSGRAFFN